MNILIVEDEGHIRQGIKSIIEQCIKEVVVVGEAENGLAAVPLIEKLTPDVVITDIRMPGMDGIELLYHIFTYHPHIKVLVLSGYDDYEYLRKAIQYEAVDYLLKPIQPKKIIEAVELIKTKIEKKSDEKQRLEYKLKKLMPLLHEKWFHLLIHGEMPVHKEEILEELGVLDILGFQLGVIYLDYNSAQKYEQDKNTINLLASQIIEETLESFPAIKYFRTPRGEIAFIYLFNDYEREIIKSFTDQVLDHLKTFLKVPPSIYISSSYSDIEQLHIAYGECADLSFMRFMVHAEVTYLDKVELKQDAHFQGEVKLLQSLNYQLHKGDVTASIQDIRSILTHLKQNAHTPNMLKQGLHSLLLNLWNSMSELECDRKHLNGIMEIAQALDKHTSWEALVNNICRVISNLAQDIKSELTDTSISIIEAKRYIEKNYFLNISLKDVAEAVHLNSSYFSHCFKLEAGINFVDYLNRLRIEKSKQIMKETRTKTYEVAELVGYRSTQHFGKMFRSITGITPSEYRETLHREMDR